MPILPSIFYSLETCQELKDKLGCYHWERSKVINHAAFEENIMIFHILKLLLIASNATVKFKIQVLHDDSDRESTDEELSLAFLEEIKTDQVHIK